MDGHVALDAGFELRRRQLSPPRLVDDADRTPIMREELDDAPGLPGVQIEIAGLGQPSQNVPGELSNRDG